MSYELFAIELPNGRDELERLNRFLATHRVASTQRQTVTRDGIPYLVYSFAKHIHSGERPLLGGGVPAADDRPDRLRATCRFL